MVTTRKRGAPHPKVQQVGGERKKKREDAQEIGKGSEENSHVQEELVESEHSKILRQRKVACERAIEITKLKESQLPDMLERRGWLAICKVKVKPANLLVQEFYANCTVDNEDDEGALRSKVRGKDVTITPAVIARVLDISRNHTSKLKPEDQSYNPTLDEVAQELCNDPEAKWDVISKVLQQARLSANYRMLNMVYNYNIHPRMHSTTLPADRATFLYTIGKDHFIDLPFYIFNVIQAAYFSKSRSDILPFGSLITRILRKIRVRPAEGEEVGKILGPINEGTWNKSNALSKNKCANSQFTSTGDAATSQPSHKHGAGPSTSTANETDMFDRIIGEINKLGCKVATLEEFVQIEITDVKARLEKVEEWVCGDTDSEPGICNFSYLPK